MQIHKYRARAFVSLRLHQNISRTSHHFTCKYLYLYTYIIYWLTSYFVCLFVCLFVFVFSELTGICLAKSPLSLSLSFFPSVLTYLIFCFVCFRLLWAEGRCFVKSICFLLYVLTCFCPFCFVFVCLLVCFFCLILFTFIFSECLSSVRVKFVQTEQVDACRKILFVRFPV